jgi:hypothetical protein
MQEQDYEYFLRNTAEFYKKYGKKYLVIKNMNLLGVYETFDEALTKTLETEDLGTFLIQECLENKDKAVHYFQGYVVPVPAGA